MTRIFNLFLGIGLILLLSGCAAQRAYEDGMDQLEAGKAEEGLAQLESASKLDPGNSQYRTQYFKQRDLLVYQWLTRAAAAKGQGAWDEAEAYYRRILKIDLENPRAKAGLATLEAEKRHAALLAEARGYLEKNKQVEAEKIVRKVLAEAPSNAAALQLRKEIEARKLVSGQSNFALKSKLTRPITIEFKDASVQAVFESISKVAGINVIFDKEVRPDSRVNLFVRDSRIEDVLHFVLVTNQLEYRILNSNTLFVFPNTPQKIKDFQERRVRNFYLTNANAKDIAAMLKSLLKIDDVYVDEKLNLVVVRDTPEAIRVAEREIAARDIAEPEVMLEVEVLEVGTSLLNTIGVQYPSQISASVVGAAGKAGQLALPELHNRTSGIVNVSLSDPVLALNLLHQDGDTNLLANPKIRVKNHEKANIHIGDRVPVISNTTTSTGIVAQSTTYLDVGLKLDVEPTVYLDNDVGINVGLEVSNVSKTIQNKDGGLVYQIGTRKANTVLRLKDGETQVLAGLINKEDRRTASGIPGLGQLPVLGRLFSNNSATASKTEIVLLITPHVVRNIIRPESPIEEFTSGTESIVTLNDFEINKAEGDEEGMPNVTSKTGGVADVVPEPVVPPASAASGNSVPASPSAVQPPAALGFVRLTLDAPKQAKVGQEFVVRLHAVAEGVQNAILDLTYDPAKFSILRVEEGDLLKGQDGKTQFMQQVHEKGGRINVGITRRGNVKGEADLVRFVVRPLDVSPGGAQFKVGASNFADASGRQLPINALPTTSISIAK